MLTSLYDRLGGEVILRTFVHQLYAYMEKTSEVTHVRDMHPASLDKANDRLFKFLSGMLGGPTLYMDEFGPPRLRQKHLHFSIGNKERDQWLQCAQYSADQLPITQDLRDELMTKLSEMANHLRNQKDPFNLGYR